MLALAFDNVAGEGDLVYSGGKLLAEGADVETAALISLLCDAPALPGDALPPGTPRRGWWADVFTGFRRPIGSRLWLLEHATATLITAARAEELAAEALRWMIDDGHLAAVKPTAELHDDAVTPAVWLGNALTLNSGEVVHLEPFRVT